MNALLHNKPGPATQHRRLSHQRTHNIGFCNEKYPFFLLEFEEYQVVNTKHQLSLSLRFRSLAIRVMILIPRG